MKLAGAPFAGISSLPISKKKMKLAGAPFAGISSLCAQREIS
jgi:4-hydroxy-L-threonine phosphate dehydrogenase PdxA